MLNHSIYCLCCTSHKMRDHFSPCNSSIFSISVSDRRVVNFKHSTIADDNRLNWLSIWLTMADQLTLATCEWYAQVLTGNIDIPKSDTQFSTTTTAGKWSRVTWRFWRHPSTTSLRYEAPTNNNTYNDRRYASLSVQCHAMRSRWLFAVWYLH